MSSTRSGPKYAKTAIVGDLVHSKATDVTAEAQCKRWYGSLWKEKWITGRLVEIAKKPVNGRNQRFYHVQFDLPDGSTKQVELRDLRCRQGPWIDTTATPDIPLLGVGVARVTPQNPESQDLLAGDFIKMKKKTIRP